MLAKGFFEQRHLAQRIRIVGQPYVEREAVVAGHDDRHRAVGGPLHLLDDGDGTDAERLRVPAGLAAPPDRHDAEAAVVVQDPIHHRAVARLEDMQGYRRARKEHDVQRKKRHVHGLNHR